MLKTVSFLSYGMAYEYVSHLLNRANENNSDMPHIVWGVGVGDLDFSVLSKIFEDDGHTAKQFVILMGGPSTGKGFLTNVKFGEKFGLINGKVMKDWLDISNVKDSEIHEGDFVLREIQKGIAIITFNRLYNACIAAGKKGFDSALSEIYYTTKDGEVNRLSDHLDYSRFVACLAHGEDMGAEIAQMVSNIKQLKRDKDKKGLRAAREELRKMIADMKEGKSVFDFGSFSMLEFKRGMPDKKLKTILNQAREAQPKSEDAFEEFYDYTMPQFWKSMRGWKDEGSSGHERFKEAARREFEKIIKNKPNEISLFGGNIIVVDSPGEDVDKQPYVGQCAEAERAGYVTNIINLDPKLGGSSVALMRLSNLTRNIDDDDRMVDDVDITAYADNVQGAVVRIVDNVFPDGPVHRYFHLVKDVQDDENLVKIFEAMNGVLHGKDDFLPDSRVTDAKTAVQAINKMKINILFATKIKSHHKIFDWWVANVRNIIFGIKPVVLYAISDGSANTELTSANALAGAEKRLSDMGDGITTQADYGEMLKSVSRWDKEMIS